MRILNTVRAESNWALDLNRLNRQGRRVAPEFLETVAKRLSFSDIPSYPAEIPLYFKNGTFDTDGREVRLDLKISRTNCCVETASSTEIGDSLSRIIPAGSMCPSRTTGTQHLWRRPQG